MKLIFNFATLDQVILLSRKEYQAVWNICILKEYEYHGYLSSSSPYTPTRNDLGETYGWKNYILKRLI